ncbi:MAG: AsmA family protein [Pseudomonadota bacterium]
MKKVFFGVALFAAGFAFYHWGDRFLARTLNAELPGILSNTLGLPVTIQPVTTWPMQLRVFTPKLVMGDEDDPAIVATNVYLTLNWRDLLRGNLILRHARGDTLMIKPSQWPSNDDPWPTDYRFLNPYLPDDIGVEEATYVGEEGNSHTFTAPQWRRQSERVVFAWEERWSDQTINVKGTLQSLPALLRLERLQLQTSAEIADNASTLIASTLDITPRTGEGYDLLLSASAMGSKAKLKTGSSASWAFPRTSRTEIDSLSIPKLRSLLANYRNGAVSTDTHELLSTEVPRLNWYDHQGQIDIESLSWNKQTALDTSLEFTTGATGIVLNRLVSQGPGGKLQGKASIDSSTEGWQLTSDANIEANDNQHGLAEPYNQSDWLWHSGMVRLNSAGATWEDLLYSLTGDVALELIHRNGSTDPIAVSAKLDNRADRLSLEAVEIKLAKGVITGSASFAGDSKKSLQASAKAQDINADFLLPETASSDLPGLPLPTFLTALPGVELDIDLVISKVTVADIQVEEADVAIQRSPDKGTVKLNARGAKGGTVAMELDATASGSGPTQVVLNTTIDKFDVARLFQQSKSSLETRTSGSINFSSDGESLADIFKAMRGVAKLDVDIRRNAADSTQEANQEQERIAISGAATLVTNDQRITGLQIHELAIENAKQDVTGSLSMVDGRIPWLEAELTSSRINVPEILSFQSSGSTSSDSDPLSLLQELGNAQLALNIDTLTLQSATLTNAQATLVTATDRLRIEALDFALGEGKVTSSGEIDWQEGQANFSLNATLTQLPIGKFLPSIPDAQARPVSGTINVKSKGQALDTLLANLSGDIQLSAETGDSTTVDTGGTASVDMTASRTEDGMLAEIHRFQWRGSDLKGSVAYHEGTPPRVDIDIDGGSLSLLPFENGGSSTDPATGDKSDKSVLDDTAEAGVNFLDDVFSAPITILFGPREASDKDKIFSSSTISFDWLKLNELTINAKIDTFKGANVVAENVSVTGSLKDSLLSLQAGADSVNRGSASGELKLDVTQTPPAMEIKGTFKNLQGDLIQANIPRSGSVNLTSRGESEAEFAANTNGLVFLELGSGAIDYDRVSLLTADVATKAFETLIPGAKTSDPKLDCAVALMVFKDGVGSTPYGYAARTDEANLIGQVDVNLKKEILHMSFSSSNRKGVGISVSSVFSNTVDIAGPLNDPKIVPNTLGILWRGWAAFLTGGLSVLGESVIKRALASDNPCDSVEEHIHKQFCTSTEAKGASSMICPAAQTGA